MQAEAALHAIIELRRQAVNPVAEKQRMELAPEPALTTPPMVLLLGNHSSGKSSLINHLLDGEVQRTGVAPTDDGFTVLLNGENARTIDGDALTSNPELPFTELARFGPGLVQHVEGRVLDAELLRHVRLIDSPGMIDAASADVERPYDFAAVVRWFAQQADLVLLFFDPEKPGTTGETISVLNESLAGIDHKLRIVMNKMDLFEGVRDFARTYGALCWNLSRSLKTKDMPHIYTTVIPEVVRDNPHMPLDDFAAALLELEQYVGSLPDRRVDNVLNRVLDEARVLALRTTVTEALRRQVALARFKVLAAFALAAGAAVGVGCYFFTTGGTLTAQLLAYGTGALLLTVGILLVRPVARWSELRGRRHLDGLFQRCYLNQLAQRDRADDLLHDWSRARAGLLRILERVGLTGIGKASRRQRKRLQQVIDKDLPIYRRA